MLQLEVQSENSFIDHILHSPDFIKDGEVYFTESSSNREAFMSKILEFMDGKSENFAVTILKNVTEGALLGASLYVGFKLFPGLSRIISGTFKFSAAAMKSLTTLTKAAFATLKGSCFVYVVGITGAVIGVAYVSAVCYSQAAKLELLHNTILLPPIESDKDHCIIYNAYSKIHRHLGVMGFYTPTWSVKRHQYFVKEWLQASVGDFWFPVNDAWILDVESALMYRDYDTLRAYFQSACIILRMLDYFLTDCHRKLGDNINVIVNSIRERTDDDVLYRVLNIYGLFVNQLYDFVNAKGIRKDDNVDISSIAGLCLCTLSRILQIYNVQRSVIGLNGRWFTDEERKKIDRLHFCIENNLSICGYSRKEMDIHHLVMYNGPYSDVPFDDYKSYLRLQKKANTKVNELIFKSLSEYNGNIDTYLQGVLGGFTDESDV